MTQKQSAMCSADPVPSLCIASSSLVPFLIARAPSPRAPLGRSHMHAPFPNTSRERSIGSQGMLVFRDDVLLVDERTTISAGKSYCARLVVHEISHQWFGNLVRVPCHCFRNLYIFRSAGGPRNFASVVWKFDSRPCHCFEICISSDTGVGSPSQNRRSMVLRSFSSL